MEDLYGTDLGSGLGYKKMPGSGELAREWDAAVG